MATDCSHTTIFLTGHIVQNITVIVRTYFSAIIIYSLIIYICKKRSGNSSFHGTDISTRIINKNLRRLLVRIFAAIKTAQHKSIRKCSRSSGQVKRTNWCNKHIAWYRYQKIYKVIITITAEVTDFKNFWNIVNELGYKLNLFVLSYSGAVPERLHFVCSGWHCLNKFYKTSYPYLILVCIAMNVLYNTHLCRAAVC